MSIKMGNPSTTSANQKLIALFGPTGVGKTAVAVQLAQILAEQGLHAVAVCADSMQIYAGMAALTGAPTADEQSKLEHRLLGYVDPSAEFSAGEFQADAHAEIDQLLADGAVAIVVGGTGFYLQAALTDLELKDPVDPKVRAALEARLGAEGAEVLHAELQRLNPKRSAQIDSTDGRRTVRALELILSGVDPVSPTNAQLWTAKLRHPTLLAGLVMDRAELVERINLRVGELIERGAHEEVAALTPTASRTARQAIGFAELERGEIEQMQARSRQLARRQMTWMRKLEGVELVDLTQRSAREAAVEIVDLWRAP